MKNTNLKNTVVFSCVFMILASCAVAQDWSQWRGANRDGKAAGFTAPKSWPKELAKKWNIPVGRADATPALVGDKLYVFARQDTDEVTLCLEAATGKELWRDKYSAGAATGAGGGMRAAALGTLIGQPSPGADRCSAAGGRVTSRCSRCRRSGCRSDHAGPPTCRGR